MTIVIPIISEFQNKGFKQAEKQTSLLDKSLKRLGITLAATFSARKIAQFTKQSVQAFIEEDKAVKALSRNLQNLGLAYDVKPIEDYISKLQRATGVADDQLRPAFQQLVTATENLAVSQDLLNLALDISAGTGKSLSSVTQALSRAYLGNNASLGRLNIGISKAELASKDFGEITDELTKKFSGQAAAAADTYAGRMAILTNAAADAQEILGEKLVKSLDLLLDTDTGVPALADSFEKLATDIGNSVLGLSKFLSLYKEIPGLGGTNIGIGDVFKKGLQAMFPQFMVPFQGFQKFGEAEAAKQRRKEEMIARANAKEGGMLRSRAVRDEKQITAEKSKQNKIDKDSLKLEKASQMFDDERISIAAALKNESLDRNEILRLELKKALINENADRAEDLAEKLRKSQAELYKLSDFKPANPFQEWLDAIDLMKSKLAALGTATIKPTSADYDAAQRIITLGSQTGNAALLEVGANTLGSLVVADIEASQRALAEANLAGAEADFSGAQVRQQAANVNVYVSGTGGLDDQAKKDVVDAVIEASSNGFATGWFRTTNRVAL